MFAKGLALLAGKTNLNDTVHELLSAKGRTGIKINTIGGRNISTNPGTTFALTKILAQHGIHENSLIIWDRTNRELREAGYKLNMSEKGLNVFGTDTQSIGYASSLIAHRNIGSRFSTIQTDLITQSISLAILKDHGLAGITAGMKNYFGAIHNPNKYHDDRCNPFVADLFDSDPIKKKHRISILDALTVQYHRGPSFHTEWAEKYGALIFSRDPVAADCAGWRIIEELRAVKGLPTLKEDNREPNYLYTAEQLGLGTANWDEIQIIETEV
ncbi:MAG: DUF362 domain-containing protein [Candidatus Aminicenantes bacterium]|nr:DUF362 domain-containing protein [Candidatus Aminicenantes bacterium]